eukprot:5896741-Karenia_brevis.AAC.1
MASKKVYAGKLQWKLEALEYITGSNIESCAPLVQELPDGEGAWIKYVDELEVLGVLLDRRGGTNASLHHRLSKAEGSYGSISRLLKDRQLQTKEKLQGWGRGPVNSALYGSGGWHFSSHNLHELRRWENKHVR